MATHTFRIEAIATRVMEVTFDDDKLRVGADPEDAATEMVIDNLFRPTLERGVTEIQGWDVTTETIRNAVAQ